MPKLIYDIKSSKNDGLIMSPSELKSIYFFGVPLDDQKGNLITNETLGFYIKSAIEEIEGYLNLKLEKQIIRESQDYYREDFRQWGKIDTTYPVVEAFKLEGYINTTKQVEYPKEWLSIKEISSGVLWDRSLNIVPAGSTADTQSIVYNGITPHAGLYSSGYIPNYWTVIYCTGFDQVPEDILNVVGKLAAINIFHIKGDLILGAGIASSSIGVDGLSQSISTTSSATNAGYGARITGYLDDLKKNLPILKSKYDGLRLTSM